MAGFTFNPILSEIHSHMQAMSPAAQAAVKMANPSIPPPDPTMTAPGVLPGMLLPHPDAGPPAGNISMPSPTPSLSSSGQPTVKAPRGTVEGDTNERGRLLSTGSGISQIGDKIEHSRLGEAHPLVGKLLGGLAQGAATVGDIGLNTLGGGFGQLAAQQIPGTQEHHDVLLHQANRQIGAEQSEAQKAAETAHENTATDVLRNPPDKFTPLSTENGIQAFDAKGGTTKPLTDAQGKPLQPFSPEHVKTIDESAYESLTGQGKTPIEALDTIYGAKNTKTEDLPHLYLDALQSGDTAKAALIKRAHEDTQVKPVQPPGVTMIVPNGEGGGTVQRIGVGGTVAPGAQTAAGVNSANTPTMTQRTAAGRAQTVVEMAPEVLGRIDAMAPKLGPIEGRWEEFMQGKVGMDNPDFSALRSDLLMLSSAVALAHAQGRLPENLREEFDRAINAPQQTAANLKATIQTMIPWLKKVQEQGQHPTGAKGTETQTQNDPLGIR